MNWYFSDQHWGHKNLAHHRGFSSVDEMNQTIVDGINQYATKRDVLYCLGDVFWEGKPEQIKVFLRQLNFKKLIFIKGNHDKPLLRFMKQNKDSRFELYDSLIIKDHGIQLHMYHYPIADWEKKFHNCNPDGYKYLHLHGHQHIVNNFPLFKEKGAVNVNVDMNDYKPLNIDDIKRIVSNQK